MFTTGWFYCLDNFTTLGCFYYLDNFLPLGCSLLGCGWIILLLWWCYYLDVYYLIYFYCSSYFRTWMCTTWTILLLGVFYYLDVFSFGWFYYLGFLLLNGFTTEIFYDLYDVSTWICLDIFYGDDFATWMFTNLDVFTISSIWMFLILGCLLLGCFPYLDVPTWVSTKQWKNT